MPSVRWRCTWTWVRFRRSAFVVPLRLLHFHHTIERCGWILARRHLPGFVAAAQMFVPMAMIIIPPVRPDPHPDITFIDLHSLIIPDLRRACRRGRRGVAAPVRGGASRLGARDRVTNLFGQHVSPQVVERLPVHGPIPVPSEMRRGLPCVRRYSRLYCDGAVRVRRRDRGLRTVSTVPSPSWSISPDRHNGIVNKFLGDGFLALFGAPFRDPDAAQHAVAAARAMLLAMDAEQWRPAAGRCASASASISARR